MSGAKTTLSTSAAKILPLTSARFFAALFVVFYHGWQILPAYAHEQGVLTRIIGFGYVSVSFFFMLSGFILAIVYLNEDKPIDRRRFYVSRFARIYPLYFAALLLDLPHFLHVYLSVTHGDRWQAFGKLAATVGLVQAWSPGLRGINDPGWSLSAEAFFYLLFPFLGPHIAKFRLSTLLPFSILTYCGGIWIVESLHASGQTYSPLPHLFVFVLGINLARFYGWIGRASERRLTLERYAPWMLFGSVAAFLAIPILRLSVPEILLQHGLLAPVFALAILALASGNRLISRLLSPSWLIVLGEASFALYLLHEPLATMLRHVIQLYGTPMFLGYVSLSVGLSVFSLLLFETPCRLWILKKDKVRSLETQVSSALMQ